LRPSVLTIAAAIVLAFWIALAFDRRRAWPSARASLRGAPGPNPLPAAPASVLVVIPARNEAESLAATLPAIGAQAATFQALVVVDDRSTDGTREVAEAFAARSSSPEKYLVVPAEPLPEGWSGKLHALESGLRAAAKLSPAAGSSEWILFTDADIHHPPDSIAWLLARAASENRDLVSVMVRLRAKSFWEKLLVPPFVWFFQLLYPFRRVADSRSRVAAAAGGCVLVRRSVLERAGGLAAIRGAIIDDVSLARRIKAAGGRLWLGLDPEMLSLRAYEGYRDVERMVARTAFDQLEYRLSLVLGTYVFLGAFFVSPPLLLVAAALAGNAAAALAAGAAWAIQCWLFGPAVRHQQVHGAFAATLPLASLLYAHMTGVSAWRHVTRRGVEWRGRTLAGGAARRAT